MTIKGLKFQITTKITEEKGRTVELCYVVSNSSDAKQTENVKLLLDLEIFTRKICLSSNSWSERSLHTKARFHSPADAEFHVFFPIHLQPFRKCSSLAQVSRNQQHAKVKSITGLLEAMQVGAHVFLLLQLKTPRLERWCQYHNSIILTVNHQTNPFHSLKCPHCQKSGWGGGVRYGERNNIHAGLLLKFTFPSSCLAQFWNVADFLQFKPFHDQRDFSLPHLPSWWAPSITYKWVFPPQPQVKTPICSPITSTVCHHAPCCIHSILGFFFCRLN